MLVDSQVLLERQNTFRPVFGALLRASRPERQHASHLRRLLAENNINYDKLKEAYETGAKEGLEKVIKNEVSTVTMMIMCYLLRHTSILNLASFLLHEACTVTSSIDSWYLLFEIIYLEVNN